MFCKQCGQEIASSPCPFCGARTTAPVASGGTPPTEQGFSALFLEADEVLVGKMMRGYLSNLILGGELKSDYVILSNKRLYYSGSGFYKSIGGKGIHKVHGNVVLPLEHVSSIEYLEARNILLLVLGILFVPLGGLGFVLIIAYFLSRRRFLLISTPSGEVEINFRLYGQSQIQQFSKDLGRALTGARRGAREQRAAAD